MSTTTRPETRVHIGWLLRRHFPEMLAIERASFEYPWREDDFLRRLRECNCIGLVAEHGDRVVGFMIYEIGKHMILLLDFAVDPAFHRQGVGRQMAAKLIGRLWSQRRTLIATEVRETNLAGQLFWRSQGFQATGVIAGHYEDTGEDAYVMEYFLPSTENTR